jgi:hypothetical protein
MGAAGVKAGSLAMAILDLRSGGAAMGRAGIIA